MSVGILYVVSTAVIAKVNSRCSVIDDFHSTLKRCLILASSSRRMMEWQSDESYRWMGILPDGDTVHEPIWLHLAGDAIRIRMAESTKERLNRAVVTSMV